jgi:hypothetical protein
MGNPKKDEKQTEKNDFSALDNLLAQLQAPANVFVREGKTTDKPEAKAQIKGILKGFECETYIPLACKFGQERSSSPSWLKDSASCAEFLKILAADFAQKGLEIIGVRYTSANERLANSKEKAPIRHCLAVRVRFYAPVLSPETDESVKAILFDSGDNLVRERLGLPVVVPSIGRFDNVGAYVAGQVNLAMESAKKGQFNRGSLISQDFPVEAATVANKAFEGEVSTSHDLAHYSKLYQSIPE